MLLTCAIMLSGCTSTVQYGDPTAVETVDIQFGSTDLQQIAAKMVDSLLTFPVVQQITTQQRPVLFVDTVRNKTTEHIDMESITDSIVNKLLRSGKFQFLDKASRDAVRKELAYQHGGGMVNINTATPKMRQLGAQYMIHGNLSSITKGSKSTRDVYYKFTLKLIDLETGLLTWQDEKEIRKNIKRTIFGL
ncbi:penicillin-binding protein activator LpoB [Candidatus Venteria ishoeyi]|uniref:penicillin-binding protein activator LpoB n=1 Tax=Candidatus Venteria ishoeyi TaxID=1899563 RepID=UPI002795B357|nr:penicillin-binding protein activator LpoB [Candidatus Venteria ishoeyi]